MLASKLQASFKKTKKVQKDSEPIDVKDFLWSKLQEQVIDWLESVKPEVIGVIEKQIVDLKRNVKKGDTGPQGKPGPAGRDGKDGEKGKDGRDGKDGKDGVGIVGPEGPAGKDGSPDTAKDIASKLNTLPESVSMEVIIGLKEMFANVQRAFNRQQNGGSGGGGMGNVVPHTVALTSATTSITLPSKVASNGRAIWLNYQGQQQAYGTHFTVSGSTVSLLFTPDDGTYADIIYIRT